MTERDVFIAALQQADPAQRRAFLDGACAQKPDLRRQVEHLLRLHEGAGSFLEKPAAEPATGVFPGAAEQAPSRDAPGAVIGPYKLLQQIGEGGMGTVFMAEQTRPVHRKVALKVIKPGMDSRLVVARFEAERQALALMDHVNIARVFDGGTTENGRPYFVMELVHGVPITKYCDDNHLSPRERLDLFVPVCQAIQHAHQKGIIHRDVKPSNVMITLYDGKPVPKVIDFGVAKATEQKLTERTLFTQYGTMVGTLEYMSPEQAEMSALGVDTRSDIYSLGVLLYELLTGSTPLCRQRVKEASYAEILRMIKEEEPPRPSTRLVESSETLPSISARRQTEPAQLTRLVRGELDWIVMKCLEKDRSRRYETASALAADVQRYLHDEPVLACPPSAAYRFRKFARRNKAALLTAAVVSVAMLVAVAALAVGIAVTWRANQNLVQALDGEREARDGERLAAYYQRTALAEREWATNNLSRMEMLLEQCPADLRGWEWYYLKRLQYSTLLPLRHDSPVLSVCFSPDGKLLATGTKAGAVRLWQAKTGHELRKWPAHQENVTAAAFSPDGRRLATGSHDGTVKLWDVEKVLRGEVQTPSLRLEPTRRVWSVAFSPDGQRLASGSGLTAEEKGELKVWDLSSRRELLALRPFADSVTCVQFSPDGRRLATTSAGLVQLWNAQTGQEQRTLRGPGTRRMGVAFSPDGRRLASVGGQNSMHPDEEVKVHDADTGEEVLGLRGHVAALKSVAFSPDGRRLASAGLDQTVKLWDPATGQEVLTLRGHLENVYCLAFSADGHQLASASLDQTVRIWDATPLEREPAPEYLTLRGHAGAVTDVAFHPTDGHSLVSAGTDGTVRVWDAWSGKRLGVLFGDPSFKRARVAYSPDGRHLAAVSAEPGRPVRVWEVATEKEICKVSDPGDGFLCLAFSPDGGHVASAGFGFLVRVWDAATAREVRPFKKNHTWPIFGVAFSPDRRHLVSGGGDSTVRVWDWTTGQEVRVLEPRHAARVADVAFSRDGKRLASASWDRTVKVWDAASWRLLHDLPHRSGAVHCVAFDRDGPRLAWGSTDGTVTVWDGPGTEPHVLRGHTSWVPAVAFSPDGKWIASASLDGTVKIWPAPPVAQAPAPEAGERAK